MENINEIYSYIRISSGQQDYYRQDSIISKYCKRNNYFLTDTYKEKVTGTKNFKERRLYELINRMKPNDVLIVNPSVDLPEPASSYLNYLPKSKLNSLASKKY